MAVVNVFLAPTKETRIEFWLPAQPHTFPAVVAIWGVKQCLGTVFFSPSLPPPNFQYCFLCLTGTIYINLDILWKTFQIRRLAFYFLSLLNQLFCQTSYSTSQKVETNLFVCRCFQDPSIKGTFHWSGNEQMTKYEMACAIADAFNLPSSHLRPVSTWHLKPSHFLKVQNSHSSGCY